MRAGLANVNGRLVRALHTRLGLAGGLSAAARLLPGDPASSNTAPSGTALSKTGPSSTAPWNLPDEPPILVIEHLQETPWASLTFNGTRHHLELRLDGDAQAVEEAADALATWTDEPDPLPGGHFLAEVQVTETAREVGGYGRMRLCLRLDALTIEE
jgi:hypothetical protein